MNKYIIILLLALSQSIFASENIFNKPQVEQLVVDSANVLSPAEESALIAKLNNFNKETSTQILVYTTSNLYGYDVADFGQRLGQGWQVGQEGFDNGIVMVIQPRIGNLKGQATIQTGYGIEEYLPDAIASRIINQEMIPYFKQNNYAAGINAGIDVCMSLTKGEFTAEDYHASGEGSGIGGFIFLLFIFIGIISMFGRSRRGRYYNSGRSNVPFWTGLFLMNSGSHRNSGWDNFSSGSGSFGGGSGFGGFGGGSFGGGGASGSW